MSGSPHSLPRVAYSVCFLANMTCTQNQQTQGLCPEYSFNSANNRITNTGYTYDPAGDLTSDGTNT
ncbi:MAG: hypothetical protein ACRD2P_07055 [Terriglobia bacterium]